MSGKHVLQQRGPITFRSSHTLSPPSLASLRPMNPWPQCTCVSGPGMGWVIPKAGDRILFCKSRDRCACVSVVQTEPVGIENIEMMWDDVERS